MAGSVVCNLTYTNKNVRDIQKTSRCTLYHVHVKVDSHMLQKQKKKTHPRHLRGSVERNTN